MRRLLVTVSLLLLPVSSVGGEAEWPVIETGRAGLNWSFSLRANPDPVSPGGTIASEARWSELPLMGSVVWYFAGVAVLGLWIALSHYAPVNLHEQFWRLPGFSSLRAPGRFAFIFVFGMAGLSAFGADAIARSRRVASGCASARASRSPRRPPRTARSRAARPPARCSSSRADAGSRLCYSTRPPGGMTR